MEKAVVFAIDIVDGILPTERTNIVRFLTRYPVSMSVNRAGLRQCYNGFSVAELSHQVSHIAIQAPELRSVSLGDREKLSSEIKCSSACKGRR